jgi:hypothetical protein
LISFLFPSAALADVGQTVIEGTAFANPGYIKYQSFGDGLEGVLDSIDISYTADTTYYTVTLRMWIEECSTVEFDDCASLAEIDLQGGWRGIRTIDLPDIAFDPCKQYRVRFMTFGLPWGTGYLAFDGSVRDTYMNGTYSEPQFVSDIYFNLHGIELAAEQSFCADPVIVVPGFLGSFEKNGTWLLDPLLHVYDDLVATFAANGYEKDKTLFEFPYDWRKSNVDTAELLKDKIEEVKAVCSCTKVDIIAHSMGGLVTRQYIQSDYYQNDVDQVVFLATPHLGAPKAYLTWEGGTRSKGIEEYLALKILEQEGEHLGYSDVFDYIRKRPISAIKELLPIYPYKIDAVTKALQDYTAEFYPVNDFIEDLEASKNLLAERSRMINIVGKNASSTIGKILTVPIDLDNGLWEHGRPLNLSNALILIDGDETVPLESAGHFGTYKELNNTHTDIPDESIATVYEELVGKIPDILIKKPNNVSKKFLYILVKSPVDISVTAPDGKRIGKDFHSEIEINQIADAFYSGFGTDDEFIVISDPIEGEYTIETEGVADGRYTLAVSHVSPESIVEASTTNSINTGSINTFTVNISSDFSTLDIEMKYPQRVVTVMSTIADINRSFELGWIYKKQVRDHLIGKIEKVIKLDKKSEIAQGKNMEKIDTRVDKKLMKALLSELKAYSEGKMNEQAYNLIKEDIEWLINN